MKTISSDLTFFARSPTLASVGLRQQERVFRRARRRRAWRLGALCLGSHRLHLVRGALHQSRKRSRKLGRGEPQERWANGGGARLAKLADELLELDDRGGYVVLVRVADVHRDDAPVDRGARRAAAQLSHAVPRAQQAERRRLVRDGLSVHLDQQPQHRLGGLGSEAVHDVAVASVVPVAVRH
uniref:Uncharacterized protein n=1 Tax=Calcidiscus leptoporus TaxID=127549 RepID=A0A7S0IRB4_9EUKA